MTEKLKITLIQKTFTRNLAAYFFKENPNLSFLDALVLLAVVDGSATKAGISPADIGDKIMSHRERCSSVDKSLERFVKRGFMVKIDSKNYPRLREVRLTHAGIKWLNSLC